MKKALFILLLTATVVSTIHAGDYDMTCERINPRKNTELYRCENNEVVCYVAVDKLGAPVPMICQFKTASIELPFTSPEKKVPNDR